MQKTEGRNMEAIQRMTLKFNNGDLLTISYLHSFSSKSEGGGLFFVLIWPRMTQ